MKTDRSAKKKIQNAKNKNSFTAKTKKKKQIQEVSFNEEDRKEYLTGFRKRNLQKKQKKADKAKEEANALKREKRREKRANLKKFIDNLSNDEAMPEVDVEGKLPILETR